MRVQQLSRKLEKKEGSLRTECGVSCTEVCGRCMKKHFRTTSDEEMPPENTKNTSESKFTINHQSYEVDVFGFHVQLSPQSDPEERFTDFTTIPSFLCSHNNNSAALFFF